MIPALESGSMVLVMWRDGNLLGRVVGDAQTMPGVGTAQQVTMETGFTAFCPLGAMFDLTRRAPKRCHISAVMGNC